MRSLAASIAILGAVGCHEDASPVRGEPDASPVPQVIDAGPAASSSPDPVTGDPAHDAPKVQGAPDARAAANAPDLGADAPETHRTAAKRAACEAAAARAVNAVPEVKKAAAGALDDARKSKGATSFGGMGPIDDADDGFTVGIGTHTDQRFEAAVWYSVDRIGHLMVTVQGDDQPIPPDTLQKVERACRP